MKNFVKKFSFLALMALVLLSALPQVTNATVLKKDVEVKVLGELNALNLVKVGGKCDKIYVQVRVKELQKIVDLRTLQLKLKYDLYFHPKLGALQGKVVGTGEVVAKQKGDYFEIVYDPTANPQGPAGNYAFKIKLLLGQKVTKSGIIVNVKINEPCKGQNNGGTNAGNNGGTDNGGANAGNNGGTDNGGANAGNNGGTDNGGANAGNNGGANAGNGANAGTANAGAPKGGHLPKTANDFASSMAVGVALALAGVAVLAYRRRESL